GEISAIAPFRYSRLLFALIVGYIAFGEVPDLLMITGSALVVGSGVYAIYRERKLRRTIPTNSANV
ncbi:MAG: DMT family transporter, partial [Ahrensia sp.]